MDRRTLSPSSRLPTPQSPLPGTWHRVRGGFRRAGSGHGAAAGPGAAQLAAAITGSGGGTCRKPPAHRRARFHLGRGRAEVNNSLLPPYTKGAGSRQGAAGTAGLPESPPTPSDFAFLLHAGRQTKSRAGTAGRCGARPGTLRSCTGSGSPPGSYTTAVRASQRYCQPARRAFAIEHHTLQIFVSGAGRTALLRHGGAEAMHFLRGHKAGGRVLPAPCRGRMRAAASER